MGNNEQKYVDAAFRCPFKLHKPSSEQTVSVQDAPFGCKSPYRDIPGEHPKYEQTMNDTIFLCTNTEREREREMEEKKRRAEN